MNVGSKFAFLAVAGLSAAMLVPAASSAQTCTGVFIRDSQSYDDGAAPNTVENKNLVVPKGTKDTFVGYVVIAGKTYYVQYRAYFHDPADIQLAKGCVLTKYPYS
jgi:hypothetical protein